MWTPKSHGIQSLRGKGSRQLSAIMQHCQLYSMKYSKNNLLGDCFLFFSYRQCFCSSSQRTQDLGWTPSCSGNIRNAMSREMESRMLYEASDFVCLWPEFGQECSSPAGASGGGFEMQKNKNTVRKKNDSANCAQNISIVGSQDKVKHCTFESLLKKSSFN